MTKRWSSTRSGDGQTKRQASKAERATDVEIASRVITECFGDRCGRLIECRFWECQELNHCQYRKD